MATLGELSRLIRSKNAGPFSLTFDVMFEDDATYRRVVDAKVLTKASFGALYGVPEEDMRAQLRTGVSVSVEASVLDRRRRARPGRLPPPRPGAKTCSTPARFSWSSLPTSSNRQARRSASSIVTRSSIRSPARGDLARVLWFCEAGERICDASEGVSRSALTHAALSQNRRQSAISILKKLQQEAHEAHAHCYGLRVGTHLATASLRAGDRAGALFALRKVLNVGVEAGLYQTIRRQVIEAAKMLAIERSRTPLNSSADC
jgi:Domain of unknown function (DUF4387)